MSKPLLFGLSAFFISNALFMWAAPDLWYDTIPGVAQTGGFNSHFIRDIALAFVVSALALASAARLSDARLALFGAALEFGIFVGDMLEASSGASSRGYRSVPRRASSTRVEADRWPGTGAFDDEEDSSALSGRGFVDVLAPDQAKLPLYHTYKIHIGAALLAALLAAAVALALAGPPWMREPCVAACVACATAGSARCSMSATWSWT